MALFCTKTHTYLWGKTVTTMGHEDDEPAAPLPLQEQVHHESRAVTSSYANNMLLGGQLAFYFSDANLRKDRFLHRELEAAADGCALQHLCYTWITRSPTSCSGGHAFAVQ